MKNPVIKKLIISFLAAALLTAVAASGVLGDFDLSMQDRLYQHAKPSDGLVTVIGMDQHALDVLGPLPWSRAVYAQAVELLNSDPENAPAVIGIDVLFAGESSDPEADTALAKAAEFGNLVLPSVGTFGSELVVDGDDFYMDSRALVAWDSPLEDFLENAETGHINAMPDSDGTIRHAMGSVTLSDGTKVKSFARVITEKYLGEELETPVDEKEFFYLNFSSTPGAYYDYVSVADLLDGSADPASFAGKIVLIAPYASGMQDQYITAIDHADPMYGIEIQANQIDAFLAGFYPTEAGSAVQLALLFVICFALCYFLIGRSVSQSVIVWAAVTAGYLGAAYLMYRLGHVMYAVYVPLAATIIFIGIIAYNYFVAQKEKRRISEKFGKYVDPAIIKELMQQSDAEAALVGKSCDIAVLFVDIRGFTSMSESLPPETVVEILNKYLTLTTECIMRHHGTLDKFVGDCTMAFWNAPVEQEDPIYLACCAAMDMAEGAVPLGRELEEKYGRSVSFGIGVHYGPAVVGNIGASKRMDYTAIGDTVNTASRLESNAPARTIYISRVVADALGNRAATTSLGGSVKLKGKTEGFEVLTLDSLERKEAK